MADLNELSLEHQTVQNSGFRKPKAQLEQVG